MCWVLLTLATATLALAFMAFGLAAISKVITDQENILMQRQIVSNRREESSEVYFLWWLNHSSQTKVFLIHAKNTLGSYSAISVIHKL